jgi:hypothetical protein
VVHLADRVAVPRAGGAALDGDVVEDADGLGEPDLLDRAAEADLAEREVAGGGGEELLLTSVRRLTALETSSGRIWMCWTTT